MTKIGVIKHIAKFISRRLSDFSATKVELLACNIIYKLSARALIAHTLPQLAPASNVVTMSQYTFPSQVWCSLGPLHINEFMNPAKLLNNNQKIKQIVGMFLQRQCHTNGPSSKKNAMKVKAASTLALSFIFNNTPIKSYSHFCFSVSYWVYIDYTQCPRFYIFTAFQ